MPKDKQAKLKYIDFLTSIGIEVKLPSSVPEPIPENEYPIPVEFMNPSFKVLSAISYRLVLI